MKLSLVIATYRRVEELRRLLLSLEQQTNRNFEVIVVDQNPDDRLTPVLEPFVGSDFPMRHLRHAIPNLSQARNCGVTIAYGDVVAFPDDDSWYEADVVATVLNRFEAEPDCDGLVATWVEQADAMPDTERAPNILHWEDWRRLRGGPASSICLFFRTSVFFSEEKFRGFDDRFGVGQWYGAAEETDFLMRLLQAGCKLVREPHAQVHHAFNPPSVDSTLSRFGAARARGRGTGALYAKHRLGLWVVIRGLVSPMFAPLKMGTQHHGFFLHIAVLIGRLEGWIAWQSKESS